MTILITGIAGYIGSHAAVHFLERGHDVVGIDNFCSSTTDALGAIEQITGKPYAFYEADVRDRMATGGVFSRHKIDCVVHFAGLKAVTESVSSPLLYYDNNIGGMLTLLCAMDGRCKRMIFSSSATVYDPAAALPFCEDSPTRPINPYGSTKLVCEQILRDYCAADADFCAIALRYFNPVGAHPGGIIGENPRGTPANLVPFIAQTASGLRDEIQIHGNDYPTPDGTCIRDYIHIEDLAHGHLLAHDFAHKNVGFYAINLGTGVGKSVLEVIAAYERAAGKKIPQRTGPRRAGDAAQSYAACERARALLGFAAKKTLDDMCADSWRFTQRQMRRGEDFA